MRAFHRALGGDAEVHAWPWGNAEVHAWPWGNAAFGSAAAPREVASFCCKKITCVLVDRWCEAWRPSRGSFMMCRHWKWRTGRSPLVTARTWEREREGGGAGWRE